MSHFIWLSMILCLLYFNRALYLRSIVMEAQARICYDQLSKGERRSAIKEWFRRLTVWLIRLGKLLGVPIEDDIKIVSPRSILLWYKKRYKDWWTLKVNASGRRPGKPPLTDKQIALIRRLARENPLWPPIVIAGMFFRLTQRWIHRDTVRKYMLPRESDPLKVLRWENFLKLHMPDIAVMDFATIKRFAQKTLYVFFVIKHGRRELLHINVTDSPTAEWIKEQLLAALGTNSQLKYLISDNDFLFRQIQDYAQDLLGVRQVRTQVASPWQNAHAERFVRTLREELLNYMLPLSESVVRQRLLEYKIYYNNVRSHSSLAMTQPIQSEFFIPQGRKELVATPLLGGLHHNYEWKECFHGKN